MTAPPAKPLRLQLAELVERWLGAANLTDERQAEFVLQLENVLQQAKLESLAEFAAGAGHEINNPVATIVGRAQLLLSTETDPDRRHSLEVIGGQALRIRDMIGDVMLFGRPPVPRCISLPLSELVAEAIRSQESLTSRQAAIIEADVAEDLRIWADRTQLLVVLTALLRNSLEVADRPGVIIKVSASRQERSERRGVVVRVQDDGPGMTDVDREHLFDPFYSGRQAGRGLGFGLSKCWRIVRQHDGEIKVLSPVDDGTAGEPSVGVLVEVWWPSTDSGG